MFRQRKLKKTNLCSQKQNFIIREKVIQVERMKRLIFITTFAIIYTFSEI